MKNFIKFLGCKEQVSMCSGNFSRCAQQTRLTYLLIAHVRGEFGASQERDPVAIAIY